MSVILYPRLFTSRHRAGDNVVVSSGDETVELLYHAWFDKSVKNTGWTYYRKVLEAAIRVFGNMDQWFHEQLSNTALPSRNRAFIIDTLDYLETGKRELSVQLWLDMIDEGGDLYNADRVSAILLKNPKIQKTDVYSARRLHSWVSKPNGMEDLITSMHLLFGKARAS